MSNRTELTRRTVLKVAGGVGAGLIIGCRMAPAKAEAQSRKPFEPNAFLSVDPSGVVTVTVSKSDMGQGIRTCLAMIAAEELDVDWKDVRVRQAEANRQKYGSQGTGGSGSTRGMVGPLRRAGAAARAMLVQAAAAKWGVEPSACTTSNGRVTNGSRSLSYGELASDAASLPLPDEQAVKTKSVAEFKIIGKPTPRVDNPDIVTGKARFGMDAKIPGMKQAVVARTPAFGARVRSVDDTAALKVPGVLKVFQIGSGVVVVAENTWAAMKGREALKTEWDLGEMAGVDSTAIRGNLLKQVTQHPDMPASVSKTVEADYDLPFLAHATMEPMNATAHVKGDTVEIWAPCQSPDQVQQQVARSLGIPVENVHLNVTLLGGGFGRRLSGEYVAEAVEISKQFGGPVQVIWSRDDDMKHDNYRPMSHHRCKGGLDSARNPVYWSHQFIKSSGGRGGTGNAGIPYAIEAATMMQGGNSAGIPTGAWRSVDHTQTGFVNESFIDEMAHAAGKDPFEFRRAIIRDERLKKCLETAAQKAGWSTPMPKGKGRGIACFSGYGSYCAHVAEVTVMPNGKVKVDRVVAVYDCGIAVNPLGANAQIEGGAMDGISTALKAEITIKDGGVEQSSFVDYEWLRIDEAPKLEIHRIEGGEGFGGLGEVGYPSMAPAVANAIFAATGKRLRKLPMRPEDLA